MTRDSDTDTDSRTRMTTGAMISTLCFAGAALALADAASQAEGLRAAKPLADRRGIGRGRAEVSDRPRRQLAQKIGVTTPPLASRTAQWSISAAKRSPRSG